MPGQVDIHSYRPFAPETIFDFSDRCPNKYGRSKFYNNSTPISFSPLPMIREIKTRKSGGSITATLPKEMMDRLHIAPGDKLYAIETKDGVLLTAYDPNFDEAMKAFEKVRRQYRNTLKKLSE